MTFNPTGNVGEFCFHPTKFRGRAAPSLGRGSCGSTLQCESLTLSFRCAAGFS
jgi:hypothetical protein